MAFICFFLAVIPTMIVSVVKAPLQAVGRMIINLLLLQSWFPDEQIWLSYNSVTWFISKLAFLFLFIIPMHRISNHLEQKWPTGGFYCGLLVIIWVLDFMLAMLLLKRNASNIKYYLYAFFNIQIGWNALVANIGSWILAVAFAYITNRIWVFDSNASTAADFLKEITSFVGGRVATLVIEELILFIFITNLGMNSMLVKIVAQVIVIVLNYVISKLIVFKK